MVRGLPHISGSALCALIRPGRHAGEILLNTKCPTADRWNQGTATVKHFNQPKHKINFQNTLTGQVRFYTKLRSKKGNWLLF